MKLKALRKGFDNVKTRDRGEVFDMDVKKCPSWCVEIKEEKEKADDKGKTSKDFELDLAVEKINAKRSAATLNAFCKDDPREAVVAACKLKINSL